MPLQHLLPPGPGASGREGSARTAARRQFCENLRGHGFCLVQCPRALQLGGSVKRVYDAARVFFRLPIERKDVSRCPTEHGYLNPKGNYQCFQVKAQHGEGFVWPGQSFQEAFVAAHSLLEKVALACFDACAEDLGSEPAELRRLLDVRAPGIDTPSRSALRCIEYSRTEGARAEYAEHTDLSFITVAPRGSRDALRVRDMSSLEELEVERAMGRDTLLVFCGDLMARLTDNHFPAAMHRPEGSWKGGTKDGNAAPDLRFALPFFLRGRSDAVLDPRRVGGSGEAAGGPVPVWALEDNVDKAREKFPWKKQPYYSAFGFSA